MTAQTTFSPAAEANQAQAKATVKPAAGNASLPAEVTEAAATVGKKERKTFKKILVAIDHEDHPAVEVALALARPLNAEVAIITVAEPLIPVSPEIGYSYEEADRQQRINAQNLLKAVERDLPENARAFTCLREGSAAEEIVNTAREWGADLVIMGTHRRGPVARLFLGSASQFVLRHGPCPVMFVGDVGETVDAPAAVPR